MVRKRVPRGRRTILQRKNSRALRGEGPMWRPFALQRQLRRHRPRQRAPESGMTGWPRGVGEFSAGGLYCVGDEALFFGAQEEPEHKTMALAEALGLPGVPNSAYPLREFGRTPTHRFSTGMRAFPQLVGRAVALDDCRLRTGPF